MAPLRLLLLGLGPWARLELAIVSGQGLETARGCRTGAGGGKSGGSRREWSWEVVSFARVFDFRCVEGDDWLRFCFFRMIFSKDENVM